MTIGIDGMRFNELASVGSVNFVFLHLVNQRKQFRKLQTKILFNRFFVVLLGFLFLLRIVGVKHICFHRQYWDIVVHFCFVGLAA